jgi:phosphatidylserine decarboxylase
MIKIHREGKQILAVSFTLIAVINIIAIQFIKIQWLQGVILLISAVFYLLIVQFFRNPKRNIPYNEKHLIAPADGKVVIIEETEEPEYFKGKRLQISIFMSPLNVHVNRYPMSGKIEYAKHHQGKYLVAWHPKSSTLNERTSVVIDNPTWGKVLYRQIAGAVARRIVMYAKEGIVVRQGDESGFIKFGSRLDLFLPLDAKVHVKIGDKPIGGETVIASMD